MKLTYLPIHFYLEFENPVFADNYPSFVIRSLLGKNLRSMCCVSHGSKCDSCSFCEKCVYASIFETIVEKQNKILPGAIRISHPFSITQNSFFDFKNPTLKKLDFTITLFGDALKYLPYIYAAFVRAGRDGMFKSRTPFFIKDVCVLEESILIDEENIKTDLTPCIFNSADFSDKKNKQILVQLHSPMRFKIAGQYTKDFLSTDFFKTLFRRMKDLCTMYGQVEEEDVTNPKTNSCESNSKNQIIEKNLRWTDYTHYSARQKKSMELGGFTGTLKIQGDFSASELAALNFCSIANIGKNTVFGLGQMEYWEK